MGSIPELLAAWRAAERRWERHAPAEEVRAAALEVIAAWAAYQDAALPPDTREFMLVADDVGTYVHATQGVTAVLGYEPVDLIGMRVVDLAAIELQETTPNQWADFLADGRQEGRFQLRAKDGRVVSLSYQARAHHPVPGFHASRLWPDAKPGVDEPADRTPSILP
jgi:PAS domain S-box-containing protein